MPLWVCPKCHREFSHQGQQHSCATKPLADHFTNKVEAYELFQYLLKQINTRVGKVKVLSIPCCIHLFGTYDFLAILPKMNGVLEIRFAADRPIKRKRIYITVPLSKTRYKNCLRIQGKKDIDVELLKWLKDSYTLKSNK